MKNIYKKGLSSVSMIAMIAGVLVVGGGAYYYFINSNVSTKGTIQNSNYDIPTGNSGSEGLKDSTVSTSVGTLFSNTCDLLTVSEVNSILGNDVIQGSIQIMPELVCQYVKKDTGDVVASVNVLGKNNTNIDINNPLLKFPPNSTLIQGIGEKAAEVVDSEMANVWFVKNGTMLLISVENLLSQPSTKAESLAKAIASKL